MAKFPLTAFILYNVVADDPLDSLLDTYIHYGHGNCTKYVDMFTPSSTVVTPVSAGSTGTTDMGDPAALCKWITEPGRDSTYNYTANQLILPYTQIEMSASYIRLGFSWYFHCNGGKQRVFTNMWVAQLPGADKLMQWEMDGSSLVSIDTPQANPSGHGMCPHY